MNENKYEVLAELTKDLAAYRYYREQAQQRMDNAVTKESKNIALESDRIAETEGRVRGIVSELGLAAVPSGAGEPRGAVDEYLGVDEKRGAQKGAEGRGA